MSVIDTKKILRELTPEDYSYANKHNDWKCSACHSQIDFLAIARQAPLHIYKDMCVCLDCANSGKYCVYCGDTTPGHMCWN